MLEKDLLEKVLENLKYGVKLNYIQYSELNKNTGMYEGVFHPVRITGILYENKAYWLLLETGCKYSWNLVIESLKNGEELDNIFIF